LEKVARNSGISAAWIRDGIGDAEHELAKISPLPPRGLRSKITRDLTHHEGAESSTLREEPHHYESSPLGQLRRAMVQAGLTPAELALRMGYAAGPVQAVFERGSRISEGMAMAIVKILPSLDIETLLGGSDTPRIIDETGMQGTFGSKPTIDVPLGDLKVKMVPMLSWTKAGTMTNFEDDCYTGEAIPAFNVTDSKAFALRVRGDSMEPRIKEGDSVVVCPSWSPQNGDTVITRTVHGDIMCKLYQSRGQRVVFSSYNPAYPPIELDREEVEWVYPVQSVVQTLRKH
jgi:SOS-response transcriptional repressor LexA